MIQVGSEQHCSLLWNEYASMLWLKALRFRRFPQLEVIISLKSHSQHCDKMRGCGKDDKDMPDLMESKYTGDEVEDLGNVNNGTQCVDDTAYDQPAKDPPGQDGQHLTYSSQAQPAHHQINPGVQPARC